MTLDLALDVAQFVVLFILSVSNGVITYSVFRVQKDRNAPKLVVYMELVEDDDREYLGLYVQNVGLVPALNVTQIPHLRLLGWLLWAYSRCGVSTGVLIGLCAASLRGLATVSHQLWSLSG